MNCPRCGRPISTLKKRCEMCGQDLDVMAKIERLSNAYYNKGLERAKVRDLSGAEMMLKKSLEINKENIIARNLLGLVEYEMGELVPALSEWIISNHLQPEENDADRYISLIQSDSVKLDTMNQCIKKYNGALAALARGNEDVATLQLKKIAALFPNYLRAIRLLSLIYIKNGEYNKAKRYLTRIQNIDVGNVTTLAYLEEIKAQTGQTDGNGNVLQGTSGEDAKYHGAVGHYREDRPNFLAFIMFFVGIVTGILVVYMLAVPNIREKARQESAADERFYDEQLADKQGTIATLNNQIELLEAQIADLKSSAIQTPEVVYVDYDEILTVAKAYVTFLNGDIADEEQLYETGKKLRALDISQYSGKNAQDLYQYISNDLDSRLMTFYVTGQRLCEQTNYVVALPYLERAMEFFPNDVNIIYYLARTYHEMEQTDKAYPLYERIYKEYSDSNYAANSNIFMMQITEERMEAQRKAEEERKANEETGGETTGTGENNGEDSGANTGENSSGEQNVTPEG